MPQSNNQSTITRPDHISHSMSQFGSVLRQVTKKAAHPNSLIYSVQLERAKQKYIVQGQLESGAEGTVALGAPEEEKTKQAVDEQESAGMKKGEEPGPQTGDDNSQVTNNGCAMEDKMN